MASNTESCTDMEEGLAGIASTTEPSSDPIPLWSRLSQSFSQSTSHFINASNLVCIAWDQVEHNLAEFFGLNDSRYQWAIDEYHYQKAQELLDGFDYSETEVEKASQEAVVLTRLEAQSLEMSRGVATSSSYNQ